MFSRDVPAFGSDVMIDARVLAISSVAELINFLLSDTNNFVTLVVCSTRERFYEQLRSSVTKQLQQDNDRNQDLDEETARRRDEEEQAFYRLDVNKQPTTRAKSLLSNSIASIANSQRVKLAFCPLLAHLRAYLAAFQRQPSNYEGNRDGLMGHGPTVLVILDLVALHSLSTQFSAQGLSRTFALVMETAHRISSSLFLCECEDAVNPADQNHGPRLWDSRVPLLNGGSTQFDGDGPLSSSFSGRHVPVRDVARRWFRFDG